MSISNKFAVVGGKSFNLCSEEQMFKNKNILVNDDSTAVEIDQDGEKMVLPIRSYGGGTLDKPGVYISSNNPFAFLSYPNTKEEKEVYIPPKENIIDFDNAKDIQSMIEMKQNEENIMAKYLETDMETGETFKPQYRDDDSVETRALKDCIIAKNINIDKYQDRWGKDFSNDKRKIKSNNITTFYILKRVCNNLDIDVDLTFRDRSPDVPNPMRKTIKVNLVPGDEYNIEVIGDTQEETGGDEDE